MYKTILVHVDGNAPSASRIDIASALALRHSAHLVGLALTGLAACTFPVGGFDPGLPAVTFPVEQLHIEAERALDTFEAAVRAAGVESFERRCVDDEAGVGISMQARYADLVIIGTLASDDLLPPLRTGYPAYVLLNCPRPVLVVPPSGVRALPCNRVAIGWNGSAAAVRAITSAIPLLRGAREVKVVVLNADREGDLHGAEPGADIGLYLARHGVAVDVLATESDLDPGAALLEYAAGSGIDLIVMGAYGHSHFREFLLGGATSTVLEASPLPLWMAH